MSKNVFRWLDIGDELFPLRNSIIDAWQGPYQANTPLVNLLNMLKVKDTWNYNSVRIIVIDFLYRLYKGKDLEFNFFCLIADATKEGLHFSLVALQYLNNFLENLTRSSSIFLWHFNPINVSVALI